MKMILSRILESGFGDGFRPDGKGAAFRVHMFHTTFSHLDQ